MASFNFYNLINNLLDFEFVLWHSVANFLCLRRFGFFLHYQITFLLGRLLFWASYKILSVQKLAPATVGTEMILVVSLA